MTEHSAKYGKMISDVIGDPKVGDRVMEYLFDADEKPTEENIRVRLREAIRAGILDQVHGLGPGRISQLQSALALGRMLYVTSSEEGLVANEPEIAASAFDQIAWEPVEKFAVLALDIRHRIISTKVIFVGSATETVASPVNIFRWLAMTGASRCILGHNHPSGSVDPSDQDRLLTKQLVAAGNIMTITVLDHLVVSQGNFFSIRDHYPELWRKN